MKSAQVVRRDDLRVLDGSWTALEVDVAFQMVMSGRR